MLCFQGCQVFKDLVGPTTILMGTKQLPPTPPPPDTRFHEHSCASVALLGVSAPRPLLYATLAELLGWHCLFSVRNTRCGVRACELVEMRVSHGQCVRVGSPVLEFVVVMFSICCWCVVTSLWRCFSPVTHWSTFQRVLDTDVEVEGQRATEDVSGDCIRETRKDM